MKRLAKSWPSPLLPVLFAACLCAVLANCALLPSRSEEVGALDEDDPIAVAAARVRGDLPSDRGPVPEDPEVLNQRVEQARSTGDITVGMSPRDVRATWGDPTRVEVAGNGHQGNQRWIYRDGFSSRWSVQPARVIYFEKDRVAGWEVSRPR